VITLLEPRKSEAILYLAAENASKLLPLPPSRCAQVQFYLSSIASFWEAEVNLQRKEVVNEENLVGRHSYTDAVEMQESENACLRDEKVQEAIGTMQLPDGAVVCVEPWTYSPDGTADMSVRRIMVSFPESTTLQPVQEYS
jgi:primary-amine oxidase